MLSLKVESILLGVFSQHKIQTISACLKESYKANKVRIRQSLEKSPR